MGINHDGDLRSLQRLRLAGLIEGTTLLILIGIAVPVKYVGGWPMATSFMGPIHGAAFIFYAVTLIEVTSSHLLNRHETVKTFIACLIPFGPFLNDALIKRKIAVVKTAEGTA